MAQGVRHPLGLFSMQALLTQALCLPPRPRDLGSLNYLDGTPYSIYAAATKVWSSRADSLISGQDSMMGLQESALGCPRLGFGATQDLCDSLEPSLDAVVAGLPGVAAMAASDAKEPPSSREGGHRRRARASDEAFGGSQLGPGLTDDVDRARAGARHSSWRPQGALLATLYEYAHQSGVPVVKVVKIWNCALLERDAAVSSSRTFALPTSTTGGRRQRLRALRTVRNSKAVAIGDESGDVFLFKIEPSRSSTSASRFVVSEQERRLVPAL